jgi:excisionase family DNA binding protein
MGSDQWLSIDQAIKYSKVSRSTLYQWCKEGRLSYKDQAGRVRVVSREGLDQILAPAVQASPAQATSFLIAAFDGLMRETYQLFADKPPRLDSIGRWVPYAIFGHVLRLGRALYLLVSSGYVDEARPTARAMVAAALNIVTIVD